MRKKIVAGNWKMNTTVTEGIALAKDIVAKINEVPADVKLVVAPPFTHLVPVAEALKGTKIALSAQNCADQPKGAYTGEVAAAMLKDAGCSMCSRCSGAYPRKLHPCMRLKCGPRSSGPRGPHCCP